MTEETKIDAKQKPHDGKAKRGGENKDTTDLVGIGRGEDRSGGKG